MITEFDIQPSHLYDNRCCAYPVLQAGLPLLRVGLLGQDSHHSAVNTNPLIRSLPLASGLVRHFFKFVHIEELKP
jgi:hypothetical protein